MSFIADKYSEFPVWDYITGVMHKDRCICVDRWRYLFNMNYEYAGMKIAFKDPDRDVWSKWVSFPGMLINEGELTAVKDMHRSILPNEIIIESDYPTFEENAEASRIVGAIIESKGFRPLYYFSGNKSIHIHVFLDMKAIDDIDILLKDEIKKKFKTTEAFHITFIKWLRGLMIRCWDTNARKFDEDLIRSTHLIRCELSKHKKGYKTFIGFTYKDIIPVAPVCNEENGLYPKIGPYILSVPNDVEGLIKEFLTAEKQKKVRVRSITDWTRLGEKEQLRDCVKAILSDEFISKGDGFQRGMFILVNELKRIYGPDQALIVVNDWNQRTGNKLTERDIEYRIRIKDYSLSCSYIHSFLESLNIDVSKKCKGKIYK